MMYHDKIDVLIIRTSEDPDVWVETYGLRGMFVPLGSEQTLNTNMTRVITRYRCILPPAADLPERVGANNLVLAWGDYQLADWEPGEAPFAGGLWLDGGVERHTNGAGRLHHYEFITKEVTG